ncbi:Flp pilus assembly protein CpaB [Aestuariicella hydrocarbonica]|uniref:Flp pilus assembly protein CpaB n=1 Tax=Pseudomaricurvus hydrocarbonicus TaxID=1470433 RepID=A0A9E5MMV5_9GAMM|nr:Flp pilus assembly protein CpaB [Aestuariicella hydrocarbonica]NHO67154.1 Flp pilus assembly protein CpaB [Aestuariicella hydrocarbonica]
MMKPRTTLLLTVSALLAISAAWLANNWALAKNQPQLESSTGVVVAATDIPYGHKLEAVNLKLLQVPEDLAPNDAIHNLEEAVDMVTKEIILEGDILRGQRISKHLEGSTLAAIISPNKRAITVRVDDVIGVAGFLLPGNMVDVLASKRDQKKTTTDTILKKIKVLAVDQTQSTNKNDPVIVRAVTLETTPTQAETIVKAREEGSIQLTLRNPLEEDEPPAPEPKKIVKRSTYNPYQTSYVTVIRGTDAEVKKVTYKK